MKAFAPFIILGIGVLLVGCASGPKLSEVQGTLAQRPQSQGRIYFYRRQVFGAAVQPSIYLNAQKVGNCVPGGVFFKDVEPGKYEAEVSTEVERKLTFVLAASEEKYVRCYISIGVFVGHGNLELVDPIEGKREIQNLAYTGS